MRKLILCCLVIALGISVYAMVEYSKKHPDTLIAHGVKTASDVGTRSNPFVSRPDEEEADAFPGESTLPPIENPATMEDIFLEPTPIGGEPLPVPVDPTMSPTSFVDPINIRAPLPLGPEEPFVPIGVESLEPIQVFPEEEGPIQPVMPHTIGQTPKPRAVMPYAQPQKAPTKSSERMPYADEQPEGKPMDKGVKRTSRKPGALLICLGEADTGINRASVRMEPTPSEKTIDQIHEALRRLLPSLGKTRGMKPDHPARVDTMEFRITDYVFGRFWRKPL